MMIPRRFAIASFLVLLALIPMANSEAVTQSSSRDRLHTIEHDGRNRNFRVHQPPGKPPEDGWPVVLVFHGGGGNIDGTARTTGGRLVVSVNGAEVEDPVTAVSSDLGWHR